MNQLLAAYIPLLISLSFTQYALDSVLLLGSAAAVASASGTGQQLQMYSGNHTVAGTAARLSGTAHPPHRAHSSGSSISAAILERAPNYRRSRSIPRLI